MSEEKNEEGSKEAESQWVKVDLQPGTPEFDEWLKERIAKANPIKRNRKK